MVYIKFNANSRWDGGAFLILQFIFLNLEKQFYEVSEL